MLFAGLGLLVVGSWGVWGALGFVCLGAWSWLGWFGFRFLSLIFGFALRDWVTGVKDFA